MKSKNKVLLLKKKCELCKKQTATAIIYAHFYCQSCVGIKKKEMKNYGKTKLHLTG